MPPEGVPAYRIRPLTESDLPALEEMYHGFSPLGAAKGLPPVREEKTHWWLGSIGSRSHSLLAVADSARVVGHAIVAGSAPAEAELAVFVHQDFRGCGIGVALARAAVEWARQNGYERLWAAVAADNTPAIQMVAACGFRKKGATWCPEHEMELRL